MNPVAGTWNLVNDGISLFVASRRYLARNHPYCWQIRLHLLVPLFVGLAVCCLALGFLIPITKYSVPDIAAWHKGLFLFSFLCVLYWLVSYFFLPDPLQMPPTIGEPPLLVLVVCAILVLAPSYGFFSLATYRLQHVFPDVTREMRVQQFLQVVARDAGDRNGIFKGAIAPARDALVSSVPLPPLPPPPQDDFGLSSQSVTAEEAFKAEYSIGPDDVIGPVAKAGRRTKQFKRDLVCKIGDAAVADMVTATRFTLQGPTSAGSDGKLIPEQPSSNGNRRSGGALSSLYSDYVTSLKYQIGQIGPDNPYCAKVDEWQCRPAVSFDCTGISDNDISHIFDDTSQTLQSFLREYLPPVSESELSQLSTMILTPFCEVGKRVKDCDTAYERLLDTIGRFEERWEQNLFRVKAVTGLYEESSGYEAALSGPSTDKQGWSLTAQATTTTNLGRPVTVSWEWLWVWLFVLALLATTIKSFRLLQETSANYAFAALFLMSAVMLFSLFDGDKFVNEKLKMVWRYFGWGELPISLDSETILIAYLVTALGYTIWQVTKSRCSPMGRVVASFNLFFLVVMGFYLPFVTDPIAGVAFYSEPWMLLIAYVIYFGVLYDFCYTIARRARERPA